MPTEHSESDGNGIKMRNRDGGNKPQKKSKGEEDMNKREKVGECVVKIDEMVIASCFLMAGLQGRRRTTRTANTPPPPLPIVTNSVYLRRQLWMIHLVNQ